jgi:hypothetical protein
MYRDPRTEELNNLRMALSTFALHLEAFEMRLRSQASNALGTPDIKFAAQVVAAMRSCPAVRDRADR